MGLDSTKKCEFKKFIKRKQFIEREREREVGQREREGEEDEEEENL